MNVQNRTSLIWLSNITARLALLHELFDEGLIILDKGQSELDLQSNLIDQSGVITIS